MSARVLQLRYAAASEVAAAEKTSQVRLALEGGREQIGVRGRVREPQLVRDALLTAVAVRDSDLRYRGKDRTAYLAYLMKQGKKATAAIWQAQKAFLEGAYADDTPRARGLDPVLTVDPDEVSLEVFSRDESAYARLAFSNEVFEGREAAHGTTLADLSGTFVEQLERLRTYQPTQFEASTALAGTSQERAVDLPDSWLRGFLQVQSAASLPAVECTIAPIDLYNVLALLRLRKAKTAPRALRIELIPGMRPRLVIEPWETLLESHGQVHQGPARIVRVYGRQRLLALARALPHVQRVRVHLLAAGLPSFWTLDMGLARLTMAMSGWSESRWASATTFDALMPRSDDAVLIERVVSMLNERGPLTLAEIEESSGARREPLRACMQGACLRGQVLFDLSTGRYRPRALLAQPVDPDTIRFASTREAAAHRLLTGEGAGEVKLTKHHVIHGEGTELWGEVNDKQARRSFAPRLTLDTEGLVREAWCNCPTYQRSALREGPCEHMIALQVFVARQTAEAERLRTTPEGRARISAETRTLFRRDGAGRQMTYRITLDDRLIRLEWTATMPGRGVGEPRRQRMWFDSDHEARAAYFARLDSLTEDGFVDDVSL